MDDTRVEPTRALPCRGGHDEPPSPARHPQLGLVPSRSSTWFGAVVLAVVVSVLAWLAPGLRPWLVAVLGTWWGVTALVQLALGHRGSCAVRRAGRWFFGPVGALLDPFDSD